MLKATHKADVFSLQLHLIQKRDQDAQSDMQSDLDAIRFIGKKRCSKKGLMTVSPFIVDLCV